VEGEGRDLIEKMIDVEEISAPRSLDTHTCGGKKPSKEGIREKVRAGINLSKGGEERRILLRDLLNVDEVDKG